jgi:hypothetical protein
MAAGFGSDDACVAVMGNSDCIIADWIAGRVFFDQVFSDAGKRTRLISGLRE